ncbi:MAG: serine/threonine-protein phosphatase, partial [Spirochaetaceae bacterium]|nr:serine/threonine-protein phosphatase [Spirochaetaceae bacterium]
ERLLTNTDEIKQLQVTVDAWSSSAKGVGGDFYFIRKISDNRFFASLCDVSGKGVTAALVVSIVWGFLRSCDMHKGLKKILESLNSSIISSFHLEKYLTGFFLIYDAETRQLQAADMGHSHTLYVRNGQNASMKKIRGNLPIGIEPDIKPMVYSLPVQDGDTLVIYTDGITEQDNPAGEEFGEERLTALVRKAAVQNKPLSEILPKALDNFRQNTPQHDDMTFLLFRF